MGYAERMQAEVRRRAAVLPREVAAWKAEADTNAQQLGIHRSQFEALKLMMGDLEARQGVLLDQFAPGLSPPQLSAIYRDLLDEIVGAHDLWRIFRFILAQHRDATTGPLVDAADLIAADCYRSCMERAAAWGIASPGEFREPPLVFLEATISPATASRGDTVGALGLTLRQYRKMRLPIPIVLIPADHADSVWLFCTIHHEVGHNLDQDLELRAEIDRRLDDGLRADGVPLDRRRTWQRWAGEILADTFGVLLGGAGFGHAMADLLLLQAPLATGVRTDDEHPDDWVRVRLLAALLRQCGVFEMTVAADQLDARWDDHQRPSGVDQYAAACDRVAEIVLVGALDALGERPLRDLAPDPARDGPAVAKLARFLRTGFLQPDPATFPWRLVPPAAQLAVMERDPPDDVTLADVQGRALKHLGNIPRPEFLATAARDEFYHKLMRGLDFRRADTTEGGG